MIQTFDLVKSGRDLTNRPIWRGNGSPAISGKSRLVKYDFIWLDISKTIPKATRTSHPPSHTCSIIFVCVFGVFFLGLGFHGMKITITTNHHQCKGLYFWVTLSKHCTIVNHHLDCTIVNHHHSPPFGRIFLQPFPTILCKSKEPGFFVGQNAFYQGVPGS